MSARRRFVSLAAVALTVAAAAGCGSSSGLPRDIPASQAPALIANLEAVMTACRTHDPRSAADAARQYASAVALLPSTVDPDVRKVLTDTAAHLTALARGGSGCQAGPSGATGVTGAVPNTTSSQAVATAPPATNTSTSTTDTTAQTPPPPSQPAAPAGGNGGGKPPANGGGSGGTSGGVGAG
jgi:hypothetical protein